MSTDRANVKDDQNKLRDFEKKWDGIAMTSFDRIWFIPFITALGAVVMDGHSLKDTWNQVDPGANQGGTPAQNAHTLTRNRRIFATLLNYIAKDCWVRDVLEAEYNDDGIAALQYIRQDDIGNVPRSTEEVNEMENEWIALTLESSAIEIGEKCILQWGNLVRTKGGLFPTAESDLQMYNKFMDGLPTQLQGKVMDERETPNVLFQLPANYAAEDALEEY